MTSETAMFLFCAASVIAIFAFASIVVWVVTPARERQTRDRLALLRTLAEQPGENAQEVLAWMKEDDERRRRQKVLNERRGRIFGGAIMIAVALGLSLMLILMGETKSWPVGLILFLVGCVVLGGGLLTNAAV